MNQETIEEFFPLKKHSGDGDLDLNVAKAIAIVKEQNLLPEDTIVWENNGKKVRLGVTIAEVDSNSRYPNNIPVKLLLDGETVFDTHYMNASAFLLTDLVPALDQEIKEYQQKLQAAGFAHRF